ncbi:MAG: hypothetical protein GY913_16575 [Proteobacteria bacterium]|nr:hypothetical protein [Pseudomonadota bacterium]
MLLALVQIAVAQDVNTVILPDFTPESVSDFTVALTITETLRRDLEARGITVIDGATLLDTVGDNADGCAETPECLPAIWEKYDAPLALVGSLANTDGGLDITVSFHQPEEESAISDYNEVVFPGAELEYTAYVADKVVDVLKLLAMFEERPAIVELAPVPGEQFDPSDLLDPDPDPEVDPDPDPVIEPDLDPVDPIDSSLLIDDPLQRREMAISKRNYSAFQTSGMSQDEWLADRRVRGGAFFIELGGGVALGSVDRSYTVELVLEQEGEGDEAGFVETERYEEDVLIGGVGVQGSLAVGVNIASRVEIALAGGLQSGRKHLQTGWEHYYEGALENEDEQSPAPAAAAVGWVEPRVRVYFLQTGLVKPYLLGAANVRFYDPYELSDTSDVVSFQPGRPAIYPIAVGGGGGLMLDVSPELAVFAEPVWTQMVSGADAYRSTTTGLATEPGATSPVTSSLRISAGLGIKF